MATERWFDSRGRVDVEMAEQRSDCGSGRGTSVVQRADAVSITREIYFRTPLGRQCSKDLCNREAALVAQVSGVLATCGTRVFGPGILSNFLCVPLCPLAKRAVIILLTPAQEMEMPSQHGLLMDLRELLGIKVDVVSEGALTGRFGELVRKESVPLCDQTGCD